MFCPNCGTPLPPGSKFCPNCGAPVSASTETPAAPAPSAVPETQVTPEPSAVPEIPAASEAPVAPEIPVVPATPQTPVKSEPPAAPTPPSPPSDRPTPAGVDGDTLALILRVVCGVLGAVFAFFALRGAFQTLRFLFNMVREMGLLFRYLGVFGTLVHIVISLLSGLINLLVPAVAAVTLLLSAAKWDKKHNDFLLCGTAAAAVLWVVRLILNVLFNFLLSILVFHDRSGLIGVSIFRSLPNLLCYVAVVGVVFLLMYLMGCPPVLGKTPEQIKANIRASITDLIGKFTSKASDEDTASAAAASKSTPAAPAAVPTAVSTVSPGAGQPLKTNRGLIVYILLSIVTCGIYQYFFIHNLAKDANELCDGDGQKTSGLLTFLLLGIITCGIYNLIWWYKLCNRMAANAPRYGLTLQENGTTYLLWVLLGSLLCGLGPLIALHFVLRNMNTLSAAYNQSHGFYG